MFKNCLSLYAKRGVLIHICWDNLNLLVCLTFNLMCLRYRLGNLPVMFTVWVSVVVGGLPPLVRYGLLVWGCVGLMCLGAVLRRRGLRSSVYTPLSGQNWDAHRLFLRLSVPFLSELLCGALLVAYWAHNWVISNPLADTIWVNGRTIGSVYPI